MCTLSVFPSSGGGFIVTGNRDESRRRDEPGQFNITEHYCYPVDGLAGGTWVGFNRSGLVMAILNRYQDPLKSDVVTRGEIIPNLLPCHDLLAARTAVLALNLVQYNPFDLVIVSNQGLLHYSNNGQTGDLKEYDLNAPYFITSSLVDAGYTLTIRRELFATFVASNKVQPLDILSQLHLNQLPQDPVSSIFMARNESHTKSISQVIVDNQGRGRLRYLTQPVIARLRNGQITAEDALGHSQTMHHHF